MYAIALAGQALVLLLMATVTLGVNDSPNRDAGAVLGLGVLVVLLLAHRGTVKRAAR